MTVRQDFLYILTCFTLEGHSNKEDEENKENGQTRKGGEECPGVLRQPFVLAQPISIGLMYMNPALIG